MSNQYPYSTDTFVERSDTLTYLLQNNNTCFLYNSSQCFYSVQHWTATLNSITCTVSE